MSKKYDSDIIDSYKLVIQSADKLMEKMYEYPYNPITATTENITDVTVNDRIIGDNDFTYEIVNKSIKDCILEMDVVLGDWINDDVELYKKEVADLEIYNKNKNCVVCQDEKDLSASQALKTLYAMKGRLGIMMISHTIKNVECKMTKTVKDNIILGSKKLKMYGKQPPVVACFDDYGKRLADTLMFSTIQEPVTITLIDEKDYGKYYLELICKTYSKWDEEDAFF